MKPQGALRAVAPTLLSLFKFFSCLNAKDTPHTNTLLISFNLLTHAHNAERKKTKATTSLCVWILPHLNGCHKQRAIVNRVIPIRLKCRCVCLFFPHTHTHTHEQTYLSLLFPFYYLISRFWMLGGHAHCYCVRHLSHTPTQTNQQKTKQKHFSVNANHGSKMYFSTSTLE